MKEPVYLSEAQLLPHIRMARFYDTERLNVTGRTKLRTAECYELSLFTQGSGMVIQNGVEHRISAGCLRFIRPGDSICSIAPYSCCTVYFSFEPVMNISCELIELMPDFITAQQQLLPIFRQLIECFTSRRTGSIAMANGLLLQLLCHAAGYSRNEAQHCPCTQSCIDYLNANYSSKLTLEDLGSELGYSALHVLRLFKRDTGISPHEYLSALRMDHARALLSETALPMKDISEQCGYSSSDYFQVVFKKANGICPGEYRRRAKLI